MTVSEPPVRGDHKSTWVAIAMILFCLAVAVLAVVGFVLDAY